MKTKTIAITIITAIIFAGIILGFSAKQVNSFEEVKNFNENIQLYKSNSCGCCGVYSEYFKMKGNSKVQIINLDDLNDFKKDKGIPSPMQSCHTTMMGDYFIEGHVPLAAIEKLLKEKPDVKGIAMPGMPSGSPGMPGVKSGDFIVYAINNDGSFEEFMRL